MSSKQLQSILKNIPSATAYGEIKNEQKIDIYEQKETLQNTSALNKKAEAEKTDRIVAEIPRSLKKQIRRYIEQNEGMTEKTVILKALKLYGFDIEDTLLLDKRTTR